MIGGRLVRWRLYVGALGVAALVTNLIAPAPAKAETELWVSGVGDDVNPCSRTAPCLTLNGALAVADPGGVIHVLDPIVVGPTVIDKAITIDGGGVVAAIDAAGGNGFTVVASVSDTVTLRNFSIDGHGTGGTGVRIVSAGTVVLDRLAIQGFLDVGVRLSGSSTPFLSLTASRIRDIGGPAVSVEGEAGPKRMFIADTAIQENASGIDVTGDARVVFVNGDLSQNRGEGVRAAGAAVSVDVLRSVVAGNGTAFHSSDGATVRISDNLIVENGIAFAAPGAAILTWENNRAFGSVGGATGSVDRHPTALSYEGDTAVLPAGTLVVTSTLRRDASVVVPGKTVSFTLPTLTGPAACAAVTNASGVAACSLPGVTLAGAAVLQVGFAGDGFLESSVVTATITPLSAASPTPTATPTSGATATPTQPGGPAATPTATLPPDVRTGPVRLHIPPAFSVYKPGW